MRSLPRMTLPSRAMAALTRYQQDADKALAGERRRSVPDVPGAVEAAWQKRRHNKALVTIELALRSMASGIERCMYCEDSLGCDIEHFRPKATFPEGLFAWPNLLWICASCNRQKNAAFDDELLDPTSDDPLEHVELSFSTGRLTPRRNSVRGEVTLRVMPRLSSDQGLTRGRQNAMVKLRVLLRAYTSYTRAGQDEEARAIRDAIVMEPFSAVFAALLRASKEPGAHFVLGDDVMTVLSEHADMYHWLADADARRHEAANEHIARTARQIRIRGSAAPDEE